jgi:hypothetical protein
MDNDLDKIEQLYCNDPLPKSKRYSKSEIDQMGRLMGISNLKCDCIECGKRADFHVKRSNDGLPKGYHQGGYRQIAYCGECIPDDAKKRWAYYSDFKNWF